MFNCSMTWEHRQKKLDNEDKLLTIEELHEDLRLLKEAILKELACPRDSESAYIDLASLLICSMVAANAKR